jgi:hypothetical protein
MGEANKGWEVDWPHAAHNVEVDLQQASLLKRLMMRRDPSKRRSKGESHDV